MPWLGIARSKFFDWKTRYGCAIQDARRITEKYVQYYNNERLHSAIGFIAPADKLAGREKQIFDLRDRRLEEARERRRLARQTARENTEEKKDSPSALTDSNTRNIIPITGETDAGSAGEQPTRDNRPKFDEMDRTGADNHPRSGADPKPISENLHMPEKTHTQATLNPKPVLSNSG